MKRFLLKKLCTTLIIIVTCFASLAVFGDSATISAKNTSTTVNYKLRYKNIKSRYGFVGRWFKKDINGVPHYVTVNEGSQIFFKVSGTNSIYVNFTIITKLKTPYYAYSVDGSNPMRKRITDPLIKFTNNKTHIVRIIVDGLSQKEDKWKGEIGVALRSIDTGYGKINGILPTNRLIAFYGDSITEGIRALNMNLDCDGSSAVNTYTWNSCAYLNSVPYFIGFGASGITATGTFNTCINAIKYFSSNRAAANINPNIIVINHGTNDVKANSNTFKKGYNAVLTKLHEQHKNVPIVCMIPFNQTHAQDIRECVHNKKYCYLVETKDWNLTYTDTKHPNIQGAKKAGKLLSEKLIELFGAEFFSKV